MEIHLVHYQIHILNQVLVKRDVITLGNVQRPVGCVASGEGRALVSENVHLHG